MRLRALARAARVGVSARAGRCAPSRCITVRGLPASTMLGASNACSAGVSGEPAGSWGSRRDHGDSRLSRAWAIDVASPATPSSSRATTGDSSTWPSPMETTSKPARPRRRASGATARGSSSASNVSTHGCHPEKDRVQAGSQRRPARSDTPISAMHMVDPTGALGECGRSGDRRPAAAEAGPGVQSCQGPPSPRRTSSSTSSIVSALLDPPWPGRTAPCRPSRFR